jgi:hypothetical protein
MSVGGLLFRLAAIAAVTIWLGGCQTVQVGPEHPGTRVRYKSPDPQKWVGNQVFGDRRSIFRCRPLACAENSIVSIRTAPSPTRSPDLQALQKFAQESAEREMAQAEQASTEAGNNKIREITLLTPPKVANMREFPAVHWEYRGISTNDKTIYIVRKMVFAGNTMIDVISTSFGLEVARRNNNDFVAALEIEDFAPPGPSPGPAAPPGSSAPPAPSAAPVR